MKFFLFCYGADGLVGMYDAWNQGDQGFHRATSGALGFRVSLGSRNVMDQIKRGLSFTASSTDFSPTPNCELC